MWTVLLAGPARRALKKIPSVDRARIFGVLEGMETDPFRGDVRRLTGDPRAACRRRVGDWRIFFDTYPDRNTVVITAIERRSSSTY